jgi:hypothetical protein
LGWHKDRKENPISAPSIHVGALVGAGSLWHFEEAGILLSKMLIFYFLMFVIPSGYPCCTSGYQVFKKK